MKTIQSHIGLFLFAALCIFFSNSMQAETIENETASEQFLIDSLQYNMYSGELKSSKTNEPLIFASITVVGTNIATITNNDGEFNLKIPKNVKAGSIEISHIGYKSLEIPIAKLKANKNILRMDLAVIELNSISIYPHDAAMMVRNMMKRVRENYPQEPNMMKGFYRETIKRNKSYVGIAEAVVNIHKTEYLNERADQVMIYKGRKTEDTTKMDTLLFKLQGGPATTLLFDIIKNPYSLLSEEYLNDYIYTYDNITEIDGKTHYVIKFQQIPGSEYPLYHGKYYIEANTLALTSAEFSLNLEDEDAAAKMLIRKKPAGLKVTPQNVNYLVNFKEQNGKWYFNYARGEMTFKFNWKKKLFNTNYSAMMELAITDRTEADIVRYKNSEKFKTNQIMTEQVSQFADEDFWGSNNTIEPDESIASAINKLKRKGRF